MTEEPQADTSILSKEDLKKEILKDYSIALKSRACSVIGRKEVLTGKAKFGIFGDGKEIPQIALAKQFNNGDWRSGYYRDQTIMMALEVLSTEAFFAQLYAHPDTKHDPNSGGRQMNAHFATRLLDENGRWKNQLNQKNTAADMSPTASQIPRLLGLAYASTFYRNNPELKAHAKNFSHNGNEIAFGTIGDSSTSEGLFWETLNAACVLQVPMVLSVWDDGYGISVSKKYQTSKESISKAVKGFEKEKNLPGITILSVKAWQYAECCLAYEKACQLAREKHRPVLVHVEEVTQPQGHSTSGSHERYKSAERLQWELEHDCITRMRLWILEKNIATEPELLEIEENIQTSVQESRKNAWESFISPINEEKKEVTALLNQMGQESKNAVFIQKLLSDRENTLDVSRGQILELAKKGLRYTKGEKGNAKMALSTWLKDYILKNQQRYNTFLYTPYKSALDVKNIEAIYTDDSKLLDGREILRENFDRILSQYPEVLIFGEDSGKIGGVNQSLSGLQKKYGKHRVFDTGIREASIIGQGIGLALRGLKPIAEIQYLDYLLYALQIMSDDLSSLHYRTAGGQSCPLIIRTRGHRLEGIWHAGSPMGTIINSCRGMQICVPRNMTQAAGMYNTLLKSDDPALVIESLNGYRLKERIPDNIGEFTVELGKAEVLSQGNDITLVTYGSMVRLVMDAAKQLHEIGISVEVIDVQTLLPFDRSNTIIHSVSKTNKVIFADEDVPGGATAYMLEQCMGKEGFWEFLDAKPVTLSAKAHRPAYGSDGDYFSKPNTEDIFDSCYQLMHEYDPKNYPEIY